MTDLSQLVLGVGLCFYDAKSLGFGGPVLGFPGGSDGKESACHAGDPGLTLRSIILYIYVPRRLHPFLQKIPWRREWLPTPESLPGESHGLRSLAGYSPGGHKEP